jgi:hypothetical protein
MGVGPTAAHAGTGALARFGNGGRKGQRSRETQRERAIAGKHLAKKNTSGGHARPSWKAGEAPAVRIWAYSIKNKTGMKSHFRGAPLAQT